MAKLLTTGCAALFMLSALSGCAPVLIGAIAYHSTKSSEQKKAFIEELRKRNFEREQAGLAPLDWCSEAYRFDKGWAAEDKLCKDRIDRYEAGDASALLSAGGAPAVTPVAKPTN